MSSIRIKEADVSDRDALVMLEELSERLAEITGASGKNSFDVDDMTNKRSVFYVAYEESKPVGCGALREVSLEVAEVKRVYSKVKGTGSLILREIEKKAKEFGYKRLIVETRKVNERAVHFYLSHGYGICENYGKYKGREEAVCFSKDIS